VAVDVLEDRARLCVPEVRDALELNLSHLLILLGLFNGPVVEFIRSAFVGNPVVETTAAVSTAR
jgi:hypothetical protein